MELIFLQSLASISLNSITSDEESFLVVEEARVLSVVVELDDDMLDVLLVNDLCKGSVLLFDIDLCNGFVLLGSMTR